MAQTFKTKIDKSIFFLVIIPVFFFAPFVFNSQALTHKDNDLGRTYIPLYSFIKDSVFEFNQIPLWRPTQLMGETFIGNPISSVFYPFNLIFLIFPVGLAVSIFVLSHFLISSVSTYFLARTFNLSNQASFLASLFYTFSIKLLLHFAAGHITMIAAISLFPLAALFFRRAIEYSLFSDTVIAALTFSLMYMTHPTIFYYSLIFFFVYIAYDLFSRERISLTRLKIKGLVFSSFLVLTLGLASIVLLPHLEFAKSSSRSILTVEDIAVPIWNTNKFLTSIAFPYANLKDLDHESLLYFGLIPSSLAFFGFISFKKTQKLILATFFLFALIITLGLSTPVFKIIYDYFPFLKYVRVTTRLWFILVLVSSLLAARGFERFFKKRTLLLIVVIFLFLAESVFIFFKKFREVPQLAFDNEQIYQRISDDRDFFRIYCTTYCFNPQLVSKYNLRILNGESPIAHLSALKFLEQGGNYNFNKYAVIFPPYQVWQVTSPPVPNSQLLGLASVKYVVSTYEINSPNFSKKEKFDNLYLYENLSFKKNFYFAGDEREVSIKKYSPNQITLSFQKLSEPKTLIFSELFYPGWRLSADHVALKVEKYPPSFRSVNLPKDAQEVDLKYKAQSFVVGRSLTYATIIFIFLKFLRKKSKRKMAKIE